MEYKCVLVFQKEKFHLTAPYLCHETFHVNVHVCGSCDIHGWLMISILDGLQTYMIMVIHRPITHLTNYFHLKIQDDYALFDLRWKKRITLKFAHTMTALVCANMCSNLMQGNEAQLKIWFIFWLKDPAWNGPWSQHYYKAFIYLISHSCVFDEFPVYWIC